MGDENKEWRRPSDAADALAAARKATDEAILAVEAERKAREATFGADEMPAVTPRSAEAKLLPLVEELYRDGVVVFTDGITPDQVEAAEDVVAKG